LDFWPNDSEAVAGVYRVDMKTSGDAHAPHVQGIDFSAPALLDWDDATVAVRVRISDPQGIPNIEWVKLLPLVEGQETTPWEMPREPLAFPTGDAGSTILYDDGTHGDVIAGDGIFTFDSIATRKGDREGEDAFNTWYQEYTLPAPVGIRIVVKDEDNNYALADTALVICADDCELQPVLNEDAGYYYYDTLQEAYNDALDGETLLCQGVGFSGNLLFGDAGGKTVMLEGGYDPAFADNATGVTMIGGSLTIGKGSAVLAGGRFSIQQI
jgi:hypothetical protein